MTGSNPRARIFLVRPLPPQITQGALPWHRIGRLALWAFTIVLASLGGALVHAGIAEPFYAGGRPTVTFLGLVCLLTAAAMDVRRLR